MVLKSAFLQSCNILLSPLGTIMTCSSIVISIFTYQFCIRECIMMICVHLFILWCKCSCINLFQKTEKKTVCFGKSAIHGWGLFARRAIQEGEMVHAVLPTFPQYKLSMTSLNGTKFLGCGVVSLPKIINITFCIFWKRKFDYVSETCFSFIRFWSIGGSVYGEVLQTCERFGTIRRARIAMYVNISSPFELFWVIEIGWT